MTICIAVATMSPSLHSRPVQSFIDMASTSPHLTTRINCTPNENLGIVRSYEWLYRNSTEDVIAYIHDDAECMEYAWDAKVLEEFERDPKTAIIGFGGAVRHGHPDIYKVRYDYRQLARFGYLSNSRDAEIHGQRFTGTANVAVLDGYALIVRRSFLDEIGGWKLAIDNGIDYLNYDYFLCAMARRYGYGVKVMGLSVHHHGGQTSVNGNVDRSEEYRHAHEWFYNEFRAEMPYEAK